MTRLALKLCVLVLICVGPLSVLAGCADDIRTTKTITVHEEEPVQMVSPGTEIVE